MIFLPTQTFFNLPESKRKKIIDAAREEFVQYQIKNASIARIVENAGIPRGSFYQYFSDIRDLYRYIMMLIGEEKTRYMYGVMETLGRADVFNTIKALYDAGMRFAGEHPDLATIGNAFFKEDAQFRREVMGEFEEQAMQFFERLLVMGQERGDIDQSVDIKVATFIFYTLNIAIVDYLLNNLHTDIFSEGEVFLALAEKVFYILENGMKSKEKRGDNV